MRVYFFFPRVNRIDTVVLECLKEIKTSRPFLSDRKTGGHLGPSHAHFSPKSPDQNCKISILFTIIKKLIIMSLGTTYSPQSPWEGLQVTNFDLCLHIVMVIGKCKDVFRGIFFSLGDSWVGGYVGGSFHGGICHGGREYQWWGRRIFEHYIKKSKNKYEKFFLLKVRSSIKT